MNAAPRPYLISPRLTSAVGAGPYVPSPEEPLVRPLRIYILDPTTSRLDGSIATAMVPYEPSPLWDGGRLFEMDASDAVTGATYRRLDLNNPEVLIQSGRDPSPSDPLFHQQMVYAVASLVYAAFRRALGRDLGWSFSRGEHSARRLRLRPYGPMERNAYYDAAQGELVFGTFEADANVTSRNVPHGIVHTCLSHDVIAHETTHALLDGMRAHFTHPTTPDVLAFHEAFADIIAVLLHFEHATLVRRAVRASRGVLRSAETLQDLAGQFGATTGSGRALRSALREHDEGVPNYAEAPPEPHARGSILVSAVLEAFFKIYERKAARYVKLATGSSTLPTEREPNDVLVDVLAETAAKLARQFLNITIRAIDYCPPVDITFGEFLRAVITADQDTVPEDPWGYREAWIDAFVTHGIYPRGVKSLDEHELRWDAPDPAPPNLEALSFARLQFDGEPGRPAGREELYRQAHALGEALAHGALGQCAGVVPPSSASDSPDYVDPPTVESIRTIRRVGPDGHVQFDVVAEVTQCRRVTIDGATLDVFGGSTLIFDPDGRLRLSIRKRAMRDEVVAEHRAFIESAQGERCWRRVGDRWEQVAEVFRKLHGASEAS